MSVSVLPEIQRIMLAVSEKANELSAATGFQKQTIEDMIGQIGNNYDSLKTLYDDTILQLEILEKISDTAGMTMIAKAWRQAVAP